MAKITRNQAFEIIKNYFLPLEVIDDGNTNEGDPISFCVYLSENSDERIGPFSINRTDFIIQERLIKGIEFIKKDRIK